MILFECSQHDKKWKGLIDWVTDGWDVLRSSFERKGKDYEENEERNKNNRVDGGEERELKLNVCERSLIRKSVVYIERCFHE
jgi:hypothetical protein